MGLITRPGSGIGASGGGGMVASYWDSVFAENLYPSLFYYQFGSKRRVPPNFGLTIKITRLKRQTGIVASQHVNSYGVPFTVANMNPLCSQVVSGTLAKFRGVYGNSDIALLTTLGDPTEFAIRDISRDLALQMDNAVRGVLSAFSQGLFLGAAGRASTSVRSTDLLRVSDIIKAVAVLKGANNPRWPDGNYPLIIHPFVGYDLKASLSGGAWLDVQKYATNDTVEKLYRGEIGRLYGARIIESTNVKRLKGGAGTGMSNISGTGHSGWQSLLLAPEAYYVCEMDQMTGRVIVKGLGSAGALDADNSLSTVAAKVFFCPIRGFQDAAPNTIGNEVRIVRLVSGCSLT